MIYSNMNFNFTLGVSVFVGKRDSHQFSYHQMTYSNKGNFLLVVDQKNDMIKKITMQGKRDYHHNNNNETQILFE